MIELKSITKKYGDKTVLSDFSLNIKRNEFLCIMGDSGAGKTTLLNIIGLLEKQNTGKVIIDGKSDFTRKDKLELKRYIFGYIFQDYLLMQDKTVKENIEIAEKYTKKINEDEMKDALKKVGLDGSYLNKKVYYLSGGEQQKVDIARVLLKPFELILADEPTGNLDEKNAMEIIKLFKDIQDQGKTIICVTHDKAIANSADRVINLQTYIN